MIQQFYSWLLIQEIGSTYLLKDLSTNVHISFIINGPKLKTTY